MKRVFHGLLAFILALSFTVSPAHAAGMGWETPLDFKMKWSQVTLFGTLVVGSDKGLASYNPETGEQQWIREDLKKLAPFDVREVTGYPILILGKDEGFGGTKAEVEALNMATGETLWKSDKVSGAPLGVYTVPGKAQVLLFINLINEEGKDPGIYVMSFNAQTGEKEWQTEYNDKANIPLHLADNAGAFYPRADFSGYQDPVFEGEMAYVTFKGLHAINLTTGALAWGIDFKPAHKSLKKAYAAPEIEGETIYACGGGVVYAVNKADGAIKWQSEKVRSGLIAQLIPVGEMVIARIGGNFYDQGQKKYVLDKPLAVKAYNKIDGAQLWEYTGAKGGITNLVLLPEQNTVMFADIGSLVGIDTTSSGKIKEAFRLKLEFKRDIGASDVTSAGVKALTGGLGGMLSAGAKLAVGKDRQDPPISVMKTETGMVVVRGQQHILSFDPAKKEITWSLYYAAPGASGLGIALVAGVSAFTALGYQGYYASGTMSASSASSNITSQFARMDKYLDKRFSKSKSSQKTAYILTNVSDGQEEGVGVMAINLETGETSDQVVFDEKEPEYMVDELGGRLYHFKDKKNILAYDMAE